MTGRHFLGLPPEPRPQAAPPGPSRRAGRVRYVLTLEPLGRDRFGREPVQRLRAALKMLRRAFALRCVDIAEQPSAPEPHGARRTPACGAETPPSVRTCAPGIRPKKRIR